MDSYQNGQNRQNNDGQGQANHGNSTRDRAAADNIGRTSGGNFAFLRAEWPALHDEATRAERLIHHDPRAAISTARRA
jgi:type I restriction enzyme R subunit